MKNFAKSKGKRITAALLCAVMCIMSLPLSAFAFTAEEGKTVNAYYGDKYVSADGEMYYSPSTYQYIAYDANGNESLHTQSAGNSRTKLMIKDSSGSRQIMCIESGIPYNAGGTYDSKSGTNSSYFQNLPTTAQYGIMLTSVYGWRPGKTAPISGTNEDDFSMATQIILWEYQQQLRTSPTTLKANSYVKQTYEIIAVFKTAVYTGSENEFKYYQFVDAAVQEQFDGYIQRAKEKAFYDTGVSAEYGDKLITLSTCEYSGQNSRLVVVAKKVTESGGSNAPSNDGATEIQS